MEFYDSIYKNDSIIKEILNYDFDNEIMNVKWLYESNKEIYNEFTFNMKIYYPDTLNRILIDQGFHILSLWGDYNQTKFNEESSLQIYECQIN